MPAFSSAALWGALRWPVRLWLLALLGCIVWVANSRFTADMSAFLPRNPSAEQTLLVDQLTTGALSRTLMVGMTGVDAATLSTLSKDMARRMRDSGQFSFVANGESRDIEGDQALLMRYRYLLSPAVNAERFSAAGLQAAIGNSIENLGSSMGMSLKALLPRDPTGEMLSLITDFAGSNRPDSDGEVWISKDQKRALLIAQSRAAGSDTDAQEQLLGSMRQLFAQASHDLKASNAQLLLSGTPVFSVDARETIRSEASRLSILGALGVISLLLLVFRSVPKVLVCLVPVVSGALAGVTAVSLCFGVVHGITIGFGTTLIGEAVDYSIYYLMQARQAGVANDSDWLRRFWPTIRLGVMTSICGFFALVFSGFPGLAQLGVYSIAGLAAAALVTRFVLPALPIRHLGYTPSERWGQRVAAWAQVARHVRVPALLLAVAALALLVHRQDRIWGHSLSGLSPISAASQQLDEQLRADLGAPDMQYLVAVSGADLESTLLGSEVATELLNGLQRQGVLQSFESPSRVLPSQLAQRQRQQALPAAQDLQNSLAEALRGLPLKAERLSPFLADVEAARQLPLLTPAAFAGTAMQASLDALLMPRPQGWVAFLPLRVANGQPMAAVRTAIQGAQTSAQPGAAKLMFVDLGEESTGMYTTYFHEAVLLSLLGSLAVLVLLAVVLRDWRATLRVVLPLTMSIVLVMAGLVLLGRPLNLLHLVGMLLVVAVGSNYALFFNQRFESVQALNGVVAPLLLANLSTVIGFGVLALSSVPVLNAMGVVVAPGAVLALLLSLVFARPPVALTE